MRPSVHVVTSISIGVLLGGLTGSWQTAFWSFVSGVFIDLDHVIDYCWARRQWVSIKDFFSFWQHFQEQKIVLIFHNVEGVVLLGMLAGLGFFPALTGGLAIGMGHHLLLDQWGNEARWNCYFFINRVIQKFETRKLFKFLEKH